jgi:hypothetical protein
VAAPAAKGLFLMTMDSTVFEQLVAAQQDGGPEKVLEVLAQRLRAEKRYHELFEALKMRVRRRVGLPDNLTDEQRDGLEDGLLEACREVGLLLLKDGSVREGWMYLRPLGDRQLALSAIQSIPADEENLEEMIEVTLHEGVDPERGFQLVLENYGTCNAITTYESLIAQRPKNERQAAAGMLVQQLHRELTQSLRADIGRQEGKEPAETTVGELVADRDWLFGDFAYHIDTTHLASTVRFARILTQPDLLRLALDLTEYGRRLSTQFQYKGEEPFADIYPAHALYFRALLGDDVDPAVTYFRDKAQQLDASQVGTAAVETYVDLLVRLGRYQEAVEAAVELTPPGAHSLGIAPSLLELCELAQDYEPMLEYCRTQDNLLGFATGLLQASEERRAEV